MCRVVSPHSLTPSTLCCSVSFAHSASSNSPFLATTIFAFSPLPYFLAFLAPSLTAKLLLLTLASALEVYLMVIISVALVVSVAKERFNMDATQVGSTLREGSGVRGWVLSGLFVFGFEPHLVNASFVHKIFSLQW